MNNDTKVAFGVLGLFLVIVLVVMFSIQKYESQQSQMKKWAADHQYTMVDVPRRPWLHMSSPFWWTDKDDDVYWVVLSDHDHQKRTCWFRFRFWWPMEQAWKD